METDKSVVLETKVAGKLTNIVYQDMKNHTLEFYKVIKMDMDEIKDLLNNKPIRFEENKRLEDLGLGGKN